MMKGIIFWLIVLPAIAGCAVSPSPAAQPAPQQASKAMVITSTAFAAGEPIPAQYTCTGADTSPPLAWADAPAEAQSFALIFDDPDAPGGTWVHWLLFNLPADTRSLTENTAPPNGTRTGKNSWGRTDYGGPCPPSGTHRYLFKLYALDTPLNLDNGATKTELLSAMDGHILAETSLMGTFSR